MRFFSFPTITTFALSVTMFPVAAAVTAAVTAPALAEQTDAAKRPATPLTVDEIVGGLENPWGMAHLPDGRMAVTERPGRLRIVTTDGKISAPIEGLPAVAATGQGGLFDILLGPDFTTRGTVFLSYAEPRGKGRNGTAVMRATLTLTDAGGTLSDGTVIFRQQPAIASTRHFGGRMVFDKTGALFVTTGDRGSEMQSAQDPASELGKVIRITTDGQPAPGNPFADGKSADGKPARATVWSYGHRNIQGAALNPATGELWQTEHGARGGDELNIARAGKNYGWPLITYGIDYDGSPIGTGKAASPGLEQPVYYWVPSIATSGLAFYSGELFPGWGGNLLAGGLAGAVLERLVLDGDTVVGREPLLQDRGDRIRTITVDSKGAVWVLTDDGRDGKLLRLTPKR